MNYNNITEIELEATCVGVSMNEWEEYMKGAVRANKTIINRMVKKLLPDLYEDLALNYYNPYNYYRTNTHLILTHSSIEYFIRYY